MNYILRKVNCKALICVAFCVVLTASCFGTVLAYTVRKIPNFWFDQKFVFYAEGISPRSTTLTSVTISYDSLADLVYYCNEHKLSTSLVYNSSLGVYVGWVNDSAFSIPDLAVSSANGLLCNSAGKVYAAERESGGTTNNTYNYNTTIINPPSKTPSGTPSSSTAPSYWEELETIKGIYERVSFTVDYLSLVCDWLNFQADMLRRTFQQVDQNIVPALDAINKNIISFKDSAVSELGSISNTAFLQLDVQNRIYSAVVGLGSRLDSVIKNGAVQINTTSIDARLDKLISMYSKVNSVVLDTASVNGGQITDAVGGELQDLMFWGNTRRVYPRLLNGPISYTLNGVSASISPVVLRSVPLGTSIPAYISADPVLSAGVWKAGTTYYISDTYNAVTGEYVQRVHAWTLTGSEGISFVARGGEKSNLFLINFPDAGPAPALAANGAGSNALVGSHVIAGTSPTPFVYGNTSFDADAYNSQCWIYINGATNKPQLRTIAATASADGYKSWLKSLVTAGTPLTVHYVMADPVVSHIDPYLIAIPEGDSAISADYLRITGKYETYSSFTQTADIINAINGVQPYDDTAVVAAITSLENALSKPAATVTADLTEVTSRLDVLIENSASKIENTTVNITEDNDAFNVFYITGEDGETQPITEFAKDLSGASGKFLSVLYRLVFSDALNSADSDLGSLEDFFTSTEPEEDITTQSADGIDEEVDIWSTF